VHDPAHTSFCDVSSTFSCTSAYSSAYGSLFGVPVALLGVVWFGVVLALLAASRAGGPTLRANVPGYVFVWSTLGLSVVLYLGYAAFVILRTVCLLCVATYVAVAGIFIAAGTGPVFPMTSLPRRLGHDVRTLAASPLSLLAAASFAAAAVLAVALFPRVEARAGAVATAAAPPAITDTQRSEVEQWFDSQKREQVPVEAEGAVVVVVKFNDYFCPPCRMTFENYRPIKAKYESQSPGKVRFVTRDFPLDSRCNGNVQGGGPHPMACDAAVAVRLARERNRADALEDWLFANQETLTTASIKQAAREVAGVTDFDQRFGAVLEQVKGDTALGGLLGVRSTPTFFINGVRVVGGLQPQYLDAVIAYELRKASQ
jgi:uncharacterized membrane protein/thiol-disulfide isomerase/thioredoxin